MPVTVSYPGVYIEELPSGVHTITGVATSIAAFVGWANQGPTTPQTVLSWSDYARMYGGLDAGYPLGYAVSQFFGNGGSQAYIIRLTDGGTAAGGTAAMATLALSAAGPWTGSITFEAATQGACNPGVWANKYGIVIKPGVSPRFSLQVVYNPSPGTAPGPGVAPATVVESFANLSATTPDPQGRYVGDILNAQSNYINVMVKTNPNTLAPPAGPVTTAPLAATTVNPGNYIAATANLSGGNDGTPLTPASPAGNFESILLDSANGIGGVNLLKHVDLFNLLCVPGEVDATTIGTLANFCVQHRAFLIADCAQLDTVTTLQNGAPAAGSAATNGTNAAIYFPWINAPDPLSQGATGPFPPCGYVAGIYAATDGSRGVWKAPAGTAAGLTGVNGPYVTLNDADNGILNPVAVNCIRNFSAYGTVVWGARTLQGNDQIGSQWKYVPVRRLALFLEESLYRGTKWAVFEPNDEPLWAALRLNIGSFMQTLFRQGAFQGQTPKDAYFVKCDDETTTQSDINLGIVNVLVGFAPLLPAEFVVLQIQQMAGQIAS